MTKIVIVSGIQIINNPRVVKEANLFSALGYDVEVIAVIFDADSKQKILRVLSEVYWLHIPVIDLTDNSLLTRIQYQVSRFNTKFAIWKKKWLNIESPYQLGGFVKRLLKIANSRNADLYVVHLEKALWVGKSLARKGRKVAIDFEDWYSEDGLPEDLALRPVKLMKDCESYLLNNAVYCTTTSQVLSKVLADAYQCPIPTVVYNSFPFQERSQIDGEILDRKKLSVPSIIWFSQTIGPGRGLEELVRALNQIDLPFEFHIRGQDNREFVKFLLNIASTQTRGRILVHPQVAQHELLSRLMEHDIGYCGDLSDCLSRDLTITNKMMEYLRSGLAIVASDTKGHNEIKCLAPSAINIFHQNNLGSLILSLTNFLKGGDALLKAKRDSVSVFERKFDWDISSRVLSISLRSGLEGIRK